MAECEFAVLRRAVFGSPYSKHRNFAPPQAEIAAWQSQRNQHLAKIHWQFDTDVAGQTQAPLSLLGTRQNSVGPKEVSKPIRLLRQPTRSS